MNIKYTMLALSLGFTLTTAIAQTNPSTLKVKSAYTANGNYRGIFKIKQGLEVPFNFEIDKDKITFINADERFDGGKVYQQGDSLKIKIDQFDNEFAFKISGDSLSGTLRKQDNSGKPTSVVAKRGEKFRFKSSGAKPAADFSGTYDVTFKNASGTDEKTVGVFKQSGSKLTGTFLRITGDSRYLEGVVEGNNFYLSSFIGSTPSYYKGTFSNNNEIVGESINARGSIAFAGIQNQNAELPDAYKLTYLKDGYKTLDFSFPDVNGKKISLSDEKYKGKPVILTITGTWCPNCVDEASFIAPWYKENRNKGIEVIAIHYERQLDSAYVKKALNNFREKFGIEYDQVVAGKPDKKLVAESLPALNNFLSFPTTIFINKKGEVAKIHTGYSGPATGKFYTAFVKEFNKEVDSLLNE
ncbi:TlpA disulfide reductase family protein [Pedobacter aquatilis]|uniref:peroxiredoxin family protein n=1 Tax=Pedobacter aquatilis TaxID=351343 RepID=UPI0025B59AEB|nr:TlpA disulfide reductase family protein [Pedobacter aquatilis]MDN3588291.1 TlpA disulfide reductase family protein [Pedobacter aquatilis]